MCEMIKPPTSLTLAVTIVHNVASKSTFTGLVNDAFKPAPYCRPVKARHESLMIHIKNVVSLQYIFYDMLHCYGYYRDC